MEKLYLVGNCWFSADQGDFPNNFHFPKLITSSRDEADKKYDELAKKDDSWGCGCSSAYLISVEEGKYRLLRGNKNMINDLLNITFEK